MQTVGQLPSYYADVPLVVNSTTRAPVLPSTTSSLSKEYPDKSIQVEYCWLESVRNILALVSDDKDNQSVDNMSWAAYHATHSVLEERPSAKMPYSLVP